MGNTASFEDAAMIDYLRMTITISVSITSFSENIYWVDVLNRIDDQLQSIRLQNHGRADSTRVHLAPVRINTLDDCAANAATSSGIKAGKGILSR